MEKLAKQGINSFKFFLAYKGAMAVTDEQLLKGLRRAKELGALPMVWITLISLPAATKSQ